MKKVLTERGRSAEQARMIVCEWRAVREKCIRIYQVVVYRA